MMNIFKKSYYNKANELYKKLLNEAPEDTEEKDQFQKIEIYYSNLNKETREVLLNAIREALNATKDDKITTNKVEEAMAKEPLTVLVTDELIRKLKIQI